MIGSLYKEDRSAIAFIWPAGSLTFTESDLVQEVGHTLPAQIPLEGEGVGTITGLVINGHCQFLAIWPAP